MPVNQMRADVSAMLPKWTRCRDCNGGRDAILAAGDKYVPELSDTEPKANKAYRERGSFFNAMKRTVGGMNGAIFQQAPQVVVPDTFMSYLNDITLSNVPFETFVTDAGAEIFLTGRCGVLVDMPSVLGTDNRPYCVSYTAESMVNWRVEARNGNDVLTLLVLSEAVNMPNPGDPFTVTKIVQFRVFNLDDTGACVRTIYRQKADAQGKVDQNSDYEVFETPVTLVRKGAALTFIPFIFMGALHPTPELEDPPLLDLADVNLAHWRNSVDYENGLHMVGLPTPWVAGGKFNADEKVKIGPTTVWLLDVNGNAGMVEFSGAGLKAFTDGMDEKKKQMATLGARMLEDSPTVAETASAVKLRHSGETASLKTVAQSIELGFKLVLQIVVWWAGTVPTPQDAPVTVELNKEYLSVRASPQEIQVALTALQSGEISFATWYNLLMIGGWTREGITAEQEKLDIGNGGTESDPIEPGDVDP